MEIYFFPMLLYILNKENNMINYVRTKYNSNKIEIYNELFLKVEEDLYEEINYSIRQEIQRKIGNLPVASDGINSNNLYLILRYGMNGKIS